MRIEMFIIGVNISNIYSVTFPVLIVLKMLKIDIQMFSPVKGG